MIEHTARIDVPRRTARLNLPQQAPPVDRTGARGSAEAAPGVEADGFWDVVGGIAKVALPAIGTALGI